MCQYKSKKLKTYSGKRTAPFEDAACAEYEFRQNHGYAYDFALRHRAPNGKLEFVVQAVCKAAGLTPFTDPISKIPGI